MQSGNSVPLARFLLQSSTLPVFRPVPIQSPVMGRNSHFPLQSKIRSSQNLIVVIGSNLSSHAQESSRDFLCCGDLCRGLCTSSCVVVRHHAVSAASSLFFRMAAIKKKCTRLEQPKYCGHPLWIQSILRRDQFLEGFHQRKSVHTMQVGCFCGRSCHPAHLAIRVLPLQREIAGSLSHSVPFTFVFVPTASSRTGSGTSAFLSAIEAFPPIRSLSQRASLLWCAVAFLVLETTPFKSVVGALDTGYVSRLPCPSSPVWDLPWLPGARYHFPSTRHFVFLLSASPDLSQTPTLRLWIACSPAPLHCDLQTEFAFVSLNVISSLTSGLRSESSDCDRATQGRRGPKTPNSPHMCREAASPDALELACQLSSFQ